MKNVNPILSAIIDTAEVLNSAPDDYINPSDGLKYCAKCHTPKEAFYPADLQNQGFYKHPVMCQCAAEKRDREEAERRDFERMTRITTLRSEAFRDIPLLDGSLIMPSLHPSLLRQKSTQKIGTASSKTASACCCLGMSGQESPMPLVALPMPSLTVWSLCCSWEWPMW